MTFFCAKCQKRHSVEDISADMWGICKEDMLRGLEAITNRMQDAYENDIEISDLIADLHDSLKGFVNKMESAEETAQSGKTGTAKDESEEFLINEKVRTMFALGRQNLKDLIGVEKNGRIITGIYRVQLSKLFALYANLSPDRDLKMLDKISEQSWQNWFAEPICEKEIKVYLDENGVLDKVTDVNNVPFGYKGKMLGFRRICPHCGKLLSRAAGCAEEIVVALAGSPRAGKTSCMVAMVSSLLEQVCPGIRIIPMSHDETWDNMTVEVDRFQGCKKVRKSPTHQKEVPAYSMLVEIQSNTTIQRVLTIVDMPGEFWQVGQGLTSEFFKQYSGLYMNIDCIWFMTSKATIRLSQNEIPEEVRTSLNEQTSEDADVIYKANPTNLDKNFGTLKDHIESNQKKMPPVLVIVSKPDFMVSEVDEEATREYNLFPMNRDVLSCNAEEIADVARVHGENFYGIHEKPMFDHSRDVRMYINDCNSHFLHAVEHNCSDRFYVAVSAYGRPAVDEGLVDRRPTPYHELYPLLWTLMVTGSVRVYHQCSWQTLNFVGRIVDTEDREEGIRFHHAQVDMLLARINNRQQRRDMEIVLSNVANNLLMRKEKYSKSVIGHRRG